MDLETKVPNLKNLSSRDEKNQKSSFMHEFGNELTVIAIFIFIMIIIYHTYWSTQSFDHSIQRRQARATKTFAKPSKN